MTVHIGARVAALAGAGEVLVTQTVRDLVAGSGLGFVDRGLHRLKGVPGEWGVMAVEAGGKRPGPERPTSPAMPASAGASATGSY
jgi:class 3 adenylate cyclase